MPERSAAWNNLNDTDTDTDTCRSEEHCRELQNFGQNRLSRVKRGLTKSAEKFWKKLINEIPTLYSAHVTCW